MSIAFSFCSICSLGDDSSYLLTLPRKVPKKIIEGKREKRMSDVTEILKHLLVCVGELSSFFG